MKNKEAAEISRLRAVGLMLRSSAIPLILGAGAAFAEVFISTSRLFAETTGVALLLAAVGCLRHSVTLRSWAYMKTLELCCWIKDLDSDIREWHTDAIADEE